MATTQLMKAAATRMEVAQRKLEQARESTFTPGALKEWLTALTDYALALGEVQEFSQQSIHEKLQALARDLHQPLDERSRRTAG